MQHETIEYFDGSQKLLGELIYSKDKRGSEEHQRPAILLFPALEGRNDFLLHYAESFAQQDFIAFAADMYGDAAVGQTLDDCFELITPFLNNRKLVRKRAVLAFSTLKKLPIAAKNKIGAMGFCFGGMCVLELARSGENLAAGVTAHGVLAKSHLPTKTIRSKLLILQGYRDPQVPPESLQKFAEEMSAAGEVDWVFTFFSHAKHSFTEPNTGIMDPVREQRMGRQYNSIAAQRAFRYSLDFFAEMAEFPHA